MRYTKVAVIALISLVKNVSAQASSGSDVICHYGQIVQGGMSGWSSPSLSGVELGAPEANGGESTETGSIHPGDYGYTVPAFLPATANDLTPQLKQSLTNGLSSYGLLNAFELPAWQVNDRGQPKTSPWSSNAALIDYRDRTKLPKPQTTWTYNFEITKGQLAPDGVLTDVILVNGQFPGPPIIANFGDMIEVTVVNSLDDEGTAIHWHGMSQWGNPWNDGVPSITQCPIAPGSSYTYTFQADSYGTTWYHSHYSAQTSSGVFGPIIILGPIHPDPAAKYDLDIGPVMLSDWYHSTYEELIGILTTPGADPRPPAANNNLINGKMNYPCAVNPHLTCTEAAGVSKFSFTSGKKHLLRLINTGTSGIQKFSIDGHRMTVIAVDFVQVNPYDTDVVTLGVGQRADIVVAGDVADTEITYWMRSSLSTACSFVDGISPDAVAMIVYNSKENLIPDTTSIVTTDALDSCINDEIQLTNPIVPNESIIDDHAWKQEFHLDTIVDNLGITRWTVNGNTFKANYNEPVFQDLSTNSPVSWSNSLNLYSVPSGSTTMLFVFYNYLPVSHPMHMHGHDFRILAEGYGVWNQGGPKVPNPLRRDVYLLPPALAPPPDSSPTASGRPAFTPSFIVIQVDVNNPGVWGLHCHVVAHMSQGLWANIDENSMQLSTRDLARAESQTCTNWAKWAANNVVVEADSGL